MKTQIVKSNKGVLFLGDVQIKANNLVNGDVNQTITNDYSQRESKATTVSTRLDLGLGKLFGK